MVIVMVSKGTAVEFPVIEFPGYMEVWVVDLAQRSKGDR